VKIAKDKELASIAAKYDAEDKAKADSEAKKKSMGYLCDFFII
jgi:hypothetical protein